MEKDLCKNIFEEHSSAGCILYDDEKCDGSDGIKILAAGELLMTDTTALDFDVESISIKKGCHMTVYTGNNSISYIIN